MKVTPLKKCCAIITLTGAFVLSGSFALNHYQKEQKAKEAKITQTQAVPKYKKAGLNDNQANSLIKNNFKTNKNWLSLINDNKKCFLLVLPNDKSFYEETKGVPDDESMKKIIDKLKETNIPMYAVTNNDVNTINNQIKNQQEKSQTEVTSPYMLIYFDSDNGKTTSTNLLSSVDSSRTLVVKNTIQWIENVTK